MISAIGQGGSNIFMPSINFDSTATSALQTVTTSSSYTALAAVDGGFTNDGLAFLALLTLLDDDKQLNLAQRLLLLELILTGQTDGAAGVQTLYSATTSETTNAVLPVTGYDASGAALSGLAAAPVGAFFSAGV